MTNIELYDLSPALRVMITGFLVALIPLSWVWLSRRGASMAQRLRMLTLLTLFLTFDLVLFGAFTRLSDSGLGCPDWPGCYGHGSPLGAQVHIDAAQEAMPSGPVTHGKAWIEMIHRYLATGVGVLILTLTSISWLQRRQIKISPWWPTITLFWVCLQGAFGALTVTMKLFPAIVTMHLLGGLVLLALLKMQAVFYSQAQGESSAAVISSGLRKLLFATVALLWIQLALGGWVSTNYAVMACTDFPSCQGSLWPAMDFKQGFTIWRELGIGSNGEYLSFQALLTAIHYVHRLTAYLLFAVLLLLAVKLLRFAALRNQAYWLGGLALLQAGSGLGNVVLGWPMLGAVLHTGGAAALVVVTTGLVFCSRSGIDAVSASKSRASRLTS
ncbi:Heme A synthase [Polaromonas vacuolata]|uniref:Heme A synthase n=1 Tax=Polaromonas vacuolata TaxID=37448 RepID=A0A6H2HC28_9BURK|nr:COX15/CtaA family protein [Polaromonas vacuolata]QJC57429.1 Heme A synthase [Polaromonas vacuolata]